MSKKTVHIIIENGCIIDAYADSDVEVVVYDLDCQDPHEKEHVLAEVAKLKLSSNEIEIY